MLCKLSFKSNILQMLGVVKCMKAFYGYASIVLSLNILHLCPVPVSMAFGFLDAHWMFTCGFFVEGSYEGTAFYIQRC